MLILFISTLKLQGQELPPKTEQQLENLADATESEEEDDALLQALAHLYKNPIDLNAATANDLQQLRFINDLQIESFLNYRKLLGHLLHVYELQAVPGWDDVTINKLLPYIFIGSGMNFKQSLAARFRGGDESLLLRFSKVLEKSKGYNAANSNHFLGDGNRLLLRYRYQFKNNLLWGLIADKDAGEQFFKGKQSAGFDFYSFHFFARRLGKIKALAIGDYTVNMGQGLIQWQSLGFGKSSDVMGIKRQSEILQPYRSAGEFLFNRGAAITYEHKRLEATLFASYRRISGNISDSSTFSGFLTSGLYRTQAEQADRNRVNDFSFGGNVNYRISQLKMGVNMVYHQFSMPLQKRGEPYNYFAFSGSRLLNASVDYSYTFKNIHLFGELATDNNFKKAFVGGALLSVDSKVDLSVLHRRLDHRYQTLFANAFTENTLPINENGTYAGIVLRPAGGWQLNAYADFFSFPWLRYRADAPGAGNDYLLQLNYLPSKTAEVYILFRIKQKPLNNDGGVTNFTAEKQRQSLRLHFVNVLSKWFTLKGRAELLWYNRNEADGEEGFLGFVEGGYQKNNFKANLRLLYFETGGYNSRIYAYESDVLYSYSIPAFFNSGVRYYTNIQYNLNKKLTLWVRLAQTLYSNTRSIGSGIDEIAGNRRTEVKLQMGYQF